MEQDITANGEHTHTHTHTELVVCRQGLNYRTRSITTECPITVIKYSEVSEPEGQHTANIPVLTSATRRGA